jgi:excisionase family DNA binding protein
MLESQSRVQRRRHSEEEPRPKLDRLVSVGETGDILGVSDPTVRRLIKRGMLEAVHLSARCLRIRESSIRKLSGQAA